MIRSLIQLHWILNGNFGKFGANIFLQGINKKGFTRSGSDDSILWLLSVDHPIHPHWASVTLEEISEELER